MCPKAWEGMEIEAKSEALRQFTEESLTQIIDAGANVGMVQIGNEINNGIAGETDWTKRRQLLQAGSAAVREVSANTGQDIQIAVHFTDVSDQKGILAIAEKVKEKEIDYDIFAVSYYPFWHGTKENLTETLRKISETYDKKVLVAENSTRIRPETETARLTASGKGILYLNIRRMYKDRRMKFVMSARQWRQSVTRD